MGTEEPTRQSSHSVHIKFIVQMYDLCRSGCGCFEGVGLLGKAATAWLVSLEYNSAFQDMVHLALSLQYVLQCTYSPSAVPERFCKRGRLSPHLCRLQLSFLSLTQTNLSTVFTNDCYL